MAEVLSELEHQCTCPYIYNLICRMGAERGLKGKLHVSVLAFGVPSMASALPPPIPPGFARVSSACIPSPKPCSAPPSSYSFTAFQQMV